MALNSPRGDLYAPNISTTFGGGQPGGDFSAQRVLHNGSINNGTTVVGIPPHLPCKVIVAQSVAGQTLMFKDVFGNTCTIQFSSTTFVTNELDIAPASIEVGTNVLGITVFWSPEP